jgi:hypothetical protein
MPKPNYGFEKRQRELAKKQKKEEKLKRKAENTAATPDAADPSGDLGAPASGVPTPDSAQ